MNTLKALMVASIPFVAVAIVFLVAWISPELLITLASLFIALVFVFMFIEMFKDAKKHFDAKDGR